MKPYYEGWYMKQQRGDNVLAIIPGRASDSAFIQVITSNASRFIPYPLELFHQDHSIHIGESTFTPSGMDIHINKPEIQLSGHLRYRCPTPLRYDIMGPFALLPMETKHTVFSMRHQVEGEVILDGTTMNFNGGVGYMEGDRGHTFPNGYTWIQSVDFPGEASVVIAIAQIPLAGIRFTGCIGVVSLAGEEYRFATYLGVRIIQSSETVVEVEQRGMKLRIEILKTEGHSLQAPMRGAMERTIQESPAIPAKFLFSRHGETLLQSDNSLASYEFVLPEPLLEPLSKR